MNFKKLGNTDLKVSTICLGTMTWGEQNNQKEAFEQMNYALNCGINFFDAAEIYPSPCREETYGRTEKIIGNWFNQNKNRNKVILASKIAGPGLPWIRDGGQNFSEQKIKKALEDSLQRLQTDYIDLYQVHGPDWFTPMEETMRALDDLVRTGKVRYIGCSNYYAWQIVKANAIADQFHTQRFISAQHMYNLVRRDIECEILPACVDQGMGMLCWSPLASGFLSGRYKREEQPPNGSRISYRKDIDIPRYYREGAFDIIDELAVIANETDKSSAQVALAWLLHDHRVTAVIIGPRLVEHATNCLVVGDWGLTDEQYERLSNVCPFKHGYPWEWIEMTYGNIGGGEEFTPPHVHHVMKRG